MPGRSGATTQPPTFATPPSVGLPLRRSKHSHVARRIGSGVACARCTAALACTAVPPVYSMFMRMPASTDGSRIRRATQWP